MEAQAALIGTDGAVELNAIAEVDLYLALVVHPGHTEGDDAFGLDEALNDFGLLELGVLVVNVFDAVQHFADSLKILSFAWMLLLQTLHDFLYIHGVSCKFFVVITLLRYYVFGCD